MNTGSEHACCSSSAGSARSNAPWSETRPPASDEVGAVEGVFPLSLSQESLWLAESIRPEWPAYNMPEAWQMTGNLNVRALEEALYALVRRHEPLRTFIRAQEGRQQQVILAARPVLLSVVDLSTNSDPAAELARRLREESARPFHLSTGPLFRAGLFRLGEREHVLFLNVHHIVSDGWSQNVLARDLGRLYAGVLAGVAADLPQLTIQFADYSVWQREEATKPAARQALEYWKRRLGPPLPQVELPGDKTPPPVFSGRGHTDFTCLPPEVVRAAKGLGRAEGVTLSTVLMAAFAAWLHRATGLPEVIVGTPFAGREPIQTEELIGFFVNMHALRVDFAGDPSARELLRRVHSLVLEAAANQHAPSGAILHAVSPDRDSGSRHPLFQVVFGFQGASVDHLELPDLDARRIELANETAKFDWTVLVTHADGSVRVRSEYASDLFEAGTTAAFLTQWEELLRSMTAAPERRLSSLKLLGEQASLALVCHNTPPPSVTGPGNDTGHASRELSVSDIFERQAGIRPGATALVQPVWDGQGGVTGRSATVSYGELNRWANRLARRFQECGSGPGTRVAVCMERSADMVAVLLAVLKTGAAYVPIDAQWPAERVRFVCEDVGAGLIVCDRKEHSDRVPPGVAVFAIDSERDRIREQDDSNLGVRASGHGYVMYTSGSTGRPKGVAVTHRAIVRLVRNTNYFACCQDDVFLQFAPIPFDASTFEIWAPLLNGARLALAAPGPLSLEDLGRTIRHCGVTVLWLTAGLFNRMIDERPTDLAGVKQLLTGGEALSVPHVLKALRELPGCAIINGYGPTENTTFTCCHRVPADWTGGRSVPIGGPVSGTQVVVLDEAGNLVPTGLPGELYAGGEGLADGYVNRPELTAERFVDLELPAIGRSRWYRTGDRVRWRADGTLEFLGRFDDQVKIRGYRIEPGEIEHALRECTGVREAVVVPSRGANGESSLAAYITRANGVTPQCCELTRHLQAKLPAYMTPSTIRVLDRLPLTANGKVDRSALAMAAPEHQDSEAPHSPPRNAMEASIMNIWADVLGRNGFGVHDNFFGLGGHSLLALEVISRISATLSVHLPATVFFECPTVAALSEAAARSRPVDSPPRLSQSRRRAGELLARIEELTEEEVESLLGDPDFKNEVK